MSSCMLPGIRYDQQRVLISRVERCTAVYGYALARKRQVRYILVRGARGSRPRTRACGDRYNARPEVKTVDKQQKSSILLKRSQQPGTWYQVCSFHRGVKIAQNAGKNRILQPCWHMPCERGATVRTTEPQRLNIDFPGMEAGQGG